VGGEDVDQRIFAYHLVCVDQLEERLGRAAQHFDGWHFLRPIGLEEEPPLEALLRLQKTIRALRTPPFEGRVISHPVVLWKHDGAQLGLQFLAILRSVSPLCLRQLRVCVWKYDLVQPKPVR